MKHYKYYLIPLVIFCLVFSGCDKYLDVTPKGTRLLSTVADYDQWLNDDALITGVGQPWGYINYFADNVDVVNVSNPPTLAPERMYTWAEQFSTDIDEPPYFWGEHYSKINHFNTVILGIDAAVSGTNGQKKSLKAEALLGRALEYFYLVNEYGRPYDSTSADQDLAVPFMTSNDVSQSVPDRSTVAQIHQRIIDDLNAAIPDLPDNNSANRLRGSKAAGYSVLARIYFYARNYTDARRNAELALAESRAVMLDYNGPLPGNNFLSIRQDIIYGRMIFGSNPATLEFMRLFSSDDLRPRILFTSADNYTYTTRGATIFFPAAVTPVLTYINSGTSVQEMKLIIAECAARTNDLDVALQQLDDVRKNRIATATYEPYTSTNQEAVLQEVLKERHLELSLNGLRWFDMRRLDMENRMDTVYRYDAQGNVIATLPPHSERYTFQVPVQVLNFNPDMQQNP